MSTLIVSLPLVLVASSTVSQDVAPAVTRQLISSSEPAGKARFGHAVCWLDFDGDGVRDLAVGAPGENAVYLYFGPELTRGSRFAPEGAGEKDGFGFDVAAGPIDEQPGDELVVGAPGTARGGGKRAGSVYLISSAEPKPVLLSYTTSPGAALGTSLAVGDFDGDGLVDVAAGAPKARIEEEPSGAVYVHTPRTGTTTGWFNPIGKWKHGNYGHDLAAADANGDGKTDLFVSGIGNRNAAGLRGAGQVYVHFNPVTEASVRVAEDPGATEGDGARFGMSIDAGDVNGDGNADLLVGAPRKNGGGIEDAGACFVFFGPEFAKNGVLRLLRTGAKPHDVFGFRALAADVVGGPEPDALFGSLGRDNPHALLAWDVAAEELGTPLVLEAPKGRSSHSFQGLAASSSADARALIALGDPLAGPRASPESGRVVVWRFAR